MRRPLAALALLALALVPQRAAAQVRTELGDVTLHLFLEKSGALSPDVARIANFASFNFSPTGHGIAEGERWSALLIKVQLKSGKEVFAKGPQATVEVVQRKTKKVIRRAVLADVYVGPEGAVWKAVLVDNVGCAPMEIVVQAGAKRFAKSLDVNCGE